MWQGSAKADKELEHSESAAERTACLPYASHFQGISWRLTYSSQRRYLTHCSGLIFSSIRQDHWSKKIGHEYNQRYRIATQS